MLGAAVSSFEILPKRGKKRGTLRDKEIELLRQKSKIDIEYINTSFDPISHC